MQTLTDCVCACVLMVAPTIMVRTTIASAKMCIHSSSGVGGEQQNKKGKREIENISCPSSEERTYGSRDHEPGIQTISSPGVSLFSCVPRFP